MAGFVKPLTAAPSPGADPWGDEAKQARPLNTRHALWPARYAAVALDSCITAIEAAPPEAQADVRRDLPCATCPEAARCLVAKRKEIGPLAFGQEYQTRARASEASLFSRSLFEPMMRLDQRMVPAWRAPAATADEYRVVQAWDLAWSERVGGDWLVCMTGWVHLPTGKRHLLEIARWQQLGFVQQTDLIRTKHAAFQADMVVIESDAAQAIWYQYMKSTTVPVARHAAGGARGGKTSLAEGVPALLILLDNRVWEFPAEAGSYAQDELETFLSEAEAFTWVDDKLEGAGEHDDTVMAWWHLNWGMDRFTKAVMREDARGIVPGSR